MKVAFPLLNEKEIATDFSKSNYVGIYDDEKQSLDLIAMYDETKESDITKLFQTLLNHKLKYVISPMCSFMSLRIFKEHDLEALQAIGTNIKENIILLKQEMLEPFTAIDVYASKQCGSVCSSCEISCKN